VKSVRRDTLQAGYLSSPGSHELRTILQKRGKFAGPGYQCILEGRIRGVGKFVYFEALDLHCIVELLQLSLSLPLFLAENAKWYSGRTRQTP
jgi:hypothetical protein